MTDSGLGDKWNAGRLTCIASYHSPGSLLFISSVKMAGGREASCTVLCQTFIVFPVSFFELNYNV